MDKNLIILQVVQIVKHNKIKQQSCFSDCSKYVSCPAPPRPVCPTGATGATGITGPTGNTGPTGGTGSAISNQLW